MFRVIGSENFAPFGKFQLEFPVVANKPENLGEVHLFTGVNGTGKTRILSILCAMLGNGLHLQKRMKGADPSVITFSDAFSAAQRSPLHAAPNQIIWTAGHPTWLTRVPAFAYSGYAYVGDATVSPMGPVQKPGRDVCLSFYKPETTSQILLQAITNLLFEAAVDSLNISNNPKTISRSARLIKALESTVSQITNTEFHFKIEKFPQISLFVIWGETKLPFDVLPDGLRAIIGWLVHAIVMMDVWLQGAMDPLNTEAVFLLDEIESHLHPAWQRKILPAFQSLFPHSQIFVATHSPFVIASLNHGWIHSLKAEAGKVKIEKPKAASQGDSYISVVEEIMGVKEWFDPETEKLLSDFRSLRDQAYNINLPEQERAQLHARARQLGVQIGNRSRELDFMMGKELNQMERQLAKQP